MSSLLVQKKDFISIIIHYKVVKNKHGVTFPKVITEDEAKEMLKNPETAPNVKQFTTKWRPQTWHAQNQIYQNSTVYNPNTGNKDIDWSVYRMEMLKACLVDWDLTDENGRPIPVNEENISNLHANIANSIFDRYSESIALDEEDVKN